VDSDGSLDLVLIGDAVLKIYKGNGGASWTNIYSLNLPDLTAGRDLVIGDVDHSGRPEIIFVATYSTGWFTSVNKLKMLRENMEPSALGIALTHPVGGECLVNGAVRVVEWTSAVPDGHASSVTIDVSTTGTDGPWSAVVAGAPNNGAYQWLVPGGVTSADCYLRAIAYDSVTLTTDTAFIAQAVQIGVCDPSVGIRGISEAVAPLLFPDPCGDVLQVDNGAPIRAIIVRDASGRVLQRHTGLSGSAARIATHALADGAYALEVLNADGGRWTGTFVKRAY
jgi:hypothetical protein